MELVLKSRHRERIAAKFGRKVQGAIEEEVRVFKLLLPNPLFDLLDRLGGDVGGVLILIGDVQAGCRDSSSVVQIARRWTSSRQCVIDAQPF
jgi:hypothetical protein